MSYFCPNPNFGTLSEFKNRLNKVYKHQKKWARRNRISCFRIYDKDIPSDPLVVDIYGAYLHIAEYHSKHQLSDEEHETWWQARIQDSSEVCEIPLEHIFTKKRQRWNRRSEQYEKFDQASFITWQQENDLWFKINLTDYLDTGLFLDHRPLRKQVQEMAEGKRVLNLFSYTGSFSVYAASGGAKKVTTVDLSNTYIQWAKENFEKNDLQIRQHRFEVMDVMKFLKEDKDKYDLVVVDPPSFSNSKKMKGTWDTQRDHPKMLELIYERLNPEAIVYFSNNLRSFEPQMDRLSYASIQEITNKTIPEDFRNKKIHRCFELKK